MDKIVIKTTKTREFTAYGVNFKITDESLFAGGNKSYNRVKMGELPLVAYQDEYIIIRDTWLSGLHIEPSSGDPEDGEEFEVSIWNTDKHKNPLLTIGLLKKHIDTLATKRDEVLAYFAPEPFENDSNVKAQYRFQLLRYITQMLVDECLNDVKGWNADETKELAALKQDEIFPLLFGDTRFRQEEMRARSFENAKIFRENRGLDDDVVNWIFNHRTGWNQNTLANYMLVRDFVASNPDYNERVEYETKAWRLINYLEINGALNKATVGNSTLGINRGYKLEVLGTMEDFYGIDPEVFKQLIECTDLRFNTTIDFPIISEIRSGERTWDGQGAPDDFDIYTNPTPDDFYWVGYYSASDYSEEYLSMVQGMLPDMLKGYMEASYPDLAEDFADGENRYWFVTGAWTGSRGRFNVGVAIRVWSTDSQLHAYFKALYDEILEEDRFREWVENGVYDSDPYNALYSEMEKRYAENSLERNDAFDEDYIALHTQELWEATYWCYEELHMEEEASVEYGEFEISDDARDAICFFMATRYPERIKPSVLAWVIMRDVDRSSKDEDYNHEGFLVSNADLDWEGSVKLIAEKVFNYADGSDFVFDGIELPVFEKLPLYPAEQVLIEHVSGSFVKTLYIARIEE